MESHSTPLPPFDLVIFGATGDLALRKLLPALYWRFVDGPVGADSRIIGVAREALSLCAFRDLAQAALRRAIPAAEPEQLRHFLNHLSYHALDAGSDAGWEQFASECRHALGAERVQIFYLSTPPSLYADICRRLGQHGFNGAGSRVVLEKPIGRDRASAEAINEAVGQVFDEQRIFRIDHYLGKETVQNLLALRFGNALFEPLWNASHIQRVQITVAEDIGVGGRGAYYDAAGALRDMVQNHLLQFMCMVAMEPPPSLAPEAVRAEKLKVLQALKPIDAGNAASLTRRGQYQGGLTRAGTVPGYLEDAGKAASDTETFVALKAELSNWRWAGVPFYLCTGKRLAERISEIVVSFRSIPHSIFPEVSGAIAPNQLLLRLQPDEGIHLRLMSKYPDSDGMNLRPVSLDMSFAGAFGLRQRDAYERLLMDVVRGDLTLFMHRDEIEAAWRWIDPIERAWAESGAAPLPYPAGSWGPAAAGEFLQRQDAARDLAPLRAAG